MRYELTDGEWSIRALFNFRPAFQFSGGGWATGYNLARACAEKLLQAKTAAQ
jgi:hypothetical protein